MLISPHTQTCNDSINYSFTIFPKRRKKRAHTHTILYFINIYICRYAGCCYMYKLLQLINIKGIRFLFHHSALYSLLRKRIVRFIRTDLSKVKGTIIVNSFKMVYVYTHTYTHAQAKAFENLFPPKIA